MSDPRLLKLAKVLVNYSVECKPGKQLQISSDPIASELTLAVYEEAIKAGAHVQLEQPMDEAWELFYKYASDEQLKYVSPVRKLVVETFDALLRIEASPNRRSLSGVDPQRMAIRNKANSGIMKTYMDRSASGELRWCVTVFPNNANAQDADMSLRDYTEFVYTACMLNEEDPVLFWQELGKYQTRLDDWLKGRDKAVLKGSNIDLTLSIKDRPFVSADGKYNFPDGEIFTGPVEDSANGWIRLNTRQYSWGRKSPILSFGSRMVKWSRKRPARTSLF